MAVSQNGGKHHLNTNGVCDNGQVFSWPLNLGLSNRNDEVALKNFVLDIEGHSVHQLVLQHHNWVGVADGSLKNNTVLNRIIL